MPSRAARPAPQVSKNIFSLPPAPCSRNSTGSGPVASCGARRRTGTCPADVASVSQTSSARAVAAIVPSAAPFPATSASAKRSSRAAG